MQIVGIYFHFLLLALAADIYFLACGALVNANTQPAPPSKARMSSFQVDEWYVLLSAAYHKEHARTHAETTNERTAAA